MRLPWDSALLRNRDCAVKMRAAYSKVNASRRSGRLLKKEFHSLLPHSYLSQRERRFRKEASFMQGVENGHHSSSIDLTFSTPC